MMVLVDSSVLVDHLRDQHNDKAELFNEIIARGIPYGISVFTLQEVLQGARSEHEYTYLRDYLSSLNIYYPSSGPETYESAARLYFDLRRRGVTIRSPLDVLIAVTAIENELFLLHRDRDFDEIAAATPDLHILAVLDA